MDYLQGKLRYAIMFVLVACTFLHCAFCQAEGFDVVNVTPGRQHYSIPRKGYEKLSIYCYKGVPKHLIHFWQTVNLHLSLESDNFKTYRGGTAEHVLDEYDQHRNSWTPTLFSWRSSTIGLDPFNSSCVGVYTAADHTAFIHILRIDFWRLISFAVGLVLFLTAPSLSSNAFFYYVCGISLGLSMSLLVVFYFISRFVPKKTAVVGYLVSGSIGAYLVRALWTNLRTVLFLYQNYVFGYVSIMGLISFGVCYRIGPVSDPRSVRLIQWSLQVTGLCLMFFSSQFQEASMAIILLLLLYYNFPRSWINYLVRAWISRFPPKTKLLTDSEYHEQGARETVKALDELRKYCSSPECNQWKTILKLKKPIRFAEFIEGKSHLYDEEILEYEADNTKPSEDSSNDTDSDMTS